MVKVAVIRGDGVNSESELARAFQRAGGNVDLIHNNELLQNPSLLLNYQIFALPGGFSFGDELKSGKVHAEKLRSAFSEVWIRFIEQKGFVIGICNGFQTLMQWGIFNRDENKATLTFNSCGHFLEKWVRVKVCNEKSPWLTGLENKEMILPIRHGEGRIILSGKSHRGALQYLENPNGSASDYAALLDSTGQVLGLMPHPEAAQDEFLYPVAQAEKYAALARKLFENAITGAQK